MFAKNSVFWGNVSDIYILDYVIYDSFEKYFYHLLIKNHYEKILFWSNDLFTFEEQSISIIAPKEIKKELAQGPLGSTNLYKKAQNYLEKDLMCFFKMLKNKKLFDEKTTIVFKDIHKSLAKYNISYFNEEFKNLLENHNSNIFFVFSEKTKEGLVNIIKAANLDFLSAIDEKNYIEIKHPTKEAFLAFFNYKRVYENIPINMELVENKIDIYLTQKKQLSDIISEVENKYFLVSK